MDNALAEALMEKIMGETKHWDACRNLSRRGRTYLQQRTRLAWCVAKLSVLLKKIREMSESFVAQKNE